MALTTTAIRQAKARQKPYKLADGAGMYLLVHPNGSRYWRLKYRFNDREKTLALGVFPAVSLKEAREKAADAKKRLRNDEDPGQLKKQQKRLKRLVAKNSFQTVALEWWESKRGQWSESHADRVLKSLEREVFPKLGSRPTSEIEPLEVLEVVRVIESRDALELASRVLQRISAVFRYAVQTGKATNNPAKDLAGALKPPTTRHYKALKADELPELLREIDAYPGNTITKLALRFLMLTFVRTGELRGARWEEINNEAESWRIPGDRMKMNLDHLVPLSRQALDVLDELRQITGHRELLFPGERKPKQSISENTLLYALYRMGFKNRATSHGIRATASSVLNEQGFNPDAIERQLAHIEKNKVRGAYTHLAKYMDDRTRMMQWWADYLDNTKDENDVAPENLKRHA